MSKFSLLTIGHILVLNFIPVFKVPAQIKQNKQDSVYTIKWYEFKAVSNLDTIRKYQNLIENIALQNITMNDSILSLIQECTGLRELEIKKTNLQPMATKQQKTQQFYFSFISCHKVIR